MEFGCNHITTKVRLIKMNNNDIVAIGNYRLVRFGV
jgi:hypothetical protein